MLGRDVVATWLNYLANNPDAGTENCIGLASDSMSVRHFLDDAVDWFQQFASDQNEIGELGSASSFAIFELENVKTSKPAWSTAFTGVAGTADDIDHSGAQLHSALDYYNNTGHTILGSTISQEYCCSADNAAAQTALLQLYNIDHGII